MSLFESELEIKVPFHDLDPMNVVWHGNYVKYLEQSRCDMFDKIGYTYYDMKDDNYIYPIAKMSMKYVKPLSFNQKILIKTSLIEIEPAIIIKYKIFNGVDIVFEAESMQIGINIKTGESVYNAPEKLLQTLGIYNEK